MKYLRYKLRQLLLILLLSYLAGQQNSYSQQIIIDTNFSSIKLAENLEHFEDPTNSFTYQSIDIEDFTSLSKPSVNWGYTNSTYWLRTYLKNNTKSDVTVYLVNNNHYLEHIHIYISTDSALTDSYYFGSAEPCVEFPIPITIKANQKSQLIISVKSNSVLRVPVLIHSKNSLEKHQKTKNILMGVFIGIFLLLFVLSLFISFALKEQIYLIFGLFVLTYTIYFLGYENVLPKKLLFGKNNFLLRGSTAVIPLIQICYIYFSKLFFDLRGEVQWIKRIFKALMVVSFLHFILFLFNYYWGNRLLFYLPPIFGLILFAISIYIWIALKRTFLRYYVLATFLFILGLQLHNMANSGVIPNQFMAFNALKISYLLLLSIFAYALTDRFLLFSRNFTNTLNEKVEERTTELEDAMVKIKANQHQLVQSEKMASIGILTSGLAHELNNPLNFISGGLELIHDKNRKENSITDESILSSLGYIETGLNRATEMVSSILEFSEGKSGIYDARNIEEIIDRTLSVLKPKFQNNIELIKNYSIKHRIHVDNAKIHQVFIGILDNALYYSSKSISPKITIETLEKNAYIQISITNNGPKIDIKDVPRIFDPFFTTRDVGEGTGLGLSSALTIIQEHAGSIEVNNLNDGVRFTIKLPIKH